MVSRFEWKFENQERKKLRRRGRLQKQRHNYPKQIQSSVSRGRNTSKTRLGSVTDYDILINIQVLLSFLPQKTRFHVSQTLSYKNGYALPSRPQLGVGGDPLPVNQLTEAELDELANTRPTLTYGNPTKPAPVEFVPAHVAFDKKVHI